MRRGGIGTAGRQRTISVSASASPVSPGSRGRVKSSPGGGPTPALEYDSLREGREFLLREFFWFPLRPVFLLFRDDEGAWSPLFFLPIVEIPHQMLIENLGCNIMVNIIYY